MTSRRSEFRIRYGECDMQGVVFNANYLVYVDDAVDRWVRSSLAAETGRPLDEHFDLHEMDFDFMVKSVTLTFERAVIYGDNLVVECSVARWGRTSFEVDIVGKVRDEPRFGARVTYVSVTPVENTPVPIPALVRQALS